jgi:hypothetical protein
MDVGHLSPAKDVLQDAHLFAPVFVLVTPLVRLTACGPELEKEDSSIHVCRIGSAQEGNQNGDFSPSKFMLVNVLREPYSSIQCR